MHRSITLIQPATFQDTVVISDSEAVGEVLCNLFLYAVNRTPEFGTVTCRIEEDGNEARIKLMLESVVLEPSEQEKLFSAYQRREEVGLRPEEIVLRMGMHLCSRIAQAIGATLTWNQEAQRGTLLVSIPSSWPGSSNQATISSQ
jgi:K+-sensing histidine kinase KdpD